MSSKKPLSEPDSTVLGEPAEDEKLPDPMNPTEAMIREAPKGANISGGSDFM